MNNQKKVTRKSFIIIASVCLVLLMALSIVSAGWFTGNAAKKVKDGQKINIYENDDYNKDIEFDGIIYSIKAYDIDSYKARISITNDDFVNVWEDGSTTKAGETWQFEKGDSINFENYPIKIELLQMKKSYYKNRGMFVSIRVSEGTGGIKKSKCYDETYCHVYEGEEISLAIDGKKYDVEINYLDSDEVKLDINGEITSKLSKGDSQKLEDGSIVWIKGLTVQEYVGGSRFAAFEINTGRSYCSGNACALHEGDTLSYDGNTFEIYYIDDDEVKLIVDGGAKGITNKLSVGMTQKMGDIYVKITEINVLEVVDGERYVVFSVSGGTTTEKSAITLKTIIKDGEINLPLVYSKSGELIGFGRDSNNRLAISNNRELVYFEQKAGVDYHDKFIVSDDNLKESYLLRAKPEEEVNGVRNQTDIEKNVNGAWVEVCSNKYAGTACYIGSLTLNIKSVEYASGGDKSVVLDVGYEISFNKLYSADGSTEITFA